MSAKKILPSYRVITNGNMTGSLTGTVTNINNLDNVGIQLNWTGSPTGTFSVQVSADYAQDTNGNVTNTGHWVSLILTYWNGSAFTTTATVPASVGSPIFLDLDLLSAPWIRVIYTTASDAGTLNAFVTAKGLQ